MIEVKAPGLFTTVQDLGRPGYGPLGVSASGAADAIALRIGNRLVGNPESAAGLEMTLLGGVFVFSSQAVAAVTGSDFCPALDGSPVPMWSALLIRAGQTLAFGPTRSGARCYLCVRGGITVPLFLGSASTHVLSGLGGLEGRALRKADKLTVGLTEGTHGLKACATPPEMRKVVRVTRGPQEDWFPAFARDDFYGAPYRVTEDANRMGLRLDGPHVPCARPGEMISEGVSLGAIQISAGGQPIILFVEQQSTGGYPKIANVISADLSSVGQLRPRDEIRFELVTPAAALQYLYEQENLYQSEELFSSL